MEFVPTVMRSKDNSDAWSIGIERPDGTIGMIEGPFYFELQALNCIGIKGSKIYYFSKDSNKSTIAWRWRNDRWVKSIYYETRIIDVPIQITSFVKPLFSESNNSDDLLF